MGDEPGGTPPGGASGGAGGASGSRDPRVVTESVGAAKKCPFCGSFSHGEYFDGHGRAMCRCNDCGTEFPAGERA